MKKQLAFAFLIVSCMSFNISCGTQNSVQTAPDSMSDVQSGVILQCFDWSYETIEAHMPEIAQSGYTALQVSCIQPAKEATLGKSNEYWWLLYQPIDFCIDDTGNSALGDKSGFIKMCETAHTYRIKVIVDVVANHLGNENGYDISSAVSEELRTQSEYWHETAFEPVEYPNRESITDNSVGGLPDLNTENPEIQAMVISYLEECIDAGADGFRFDCAKHIAVPSEGSDFWPNVIRAAEDYYKTNGYYRDETDLYCYGEVLGDTEGPDISEYTAYMSVTDNDTGNKIREAIVSHGARSASTPSLLKGADPDKTVLWAESHDTYENEERESTDTSDADILKTWAIVAVKNEVSALYFARTDGYRGGMMGEMCSDACFSDEVRAINHFHNLHDGAETYMSYSGNFIITERGDEAAVIVNCDGMDTDIDIKLSHLTDGTYRDTLTDAEFTLTAGQLTGHMGESGIVILERK